MSHHIDNKEFEALKTFRGRINDLLPQFNEYQKNDLWLLRWLRARELNQVKAEEMLRKSLAWRESYFGGDENDEFTVPQIIDDEFIMQAPGFDKDDCLIAISHFGKWNVKKVCGLGLRPHFVRFGMQTFDRMMELLESRTTKEKYFSQFNIIVDFDEIKWHQVSSRQTIEAISEVVRLFESNYPETLKNAWVVNAPKYFEILFAIVKPLMTARTIAKVSVYGSGGWREQILKSVDPDQLPSEYGGSITTCKHYKARYGVDVFRTYETFPESEMTSIIIPAGMKHTVEFQLVVGGSLSWNFKTSDFDIGYAVQYQNGEGARPEILFSAERVDSHLHVQKGNIVADKVGIYSLILDNSNSRFRSKSLLYAVRADSNA